MGKITRLIPAHLVLILTLLTICISYPAQAEGVKTEIISNFEVFDADIRDVFRSLAELGGINILMDPQVKGDVSIKLKHGLAIREAIELLSQTYGYSFRWITQTRTVIIGNEKTFSNFESRETRIYHLNYAAPEQIKNALKIIITEDKIGIDTRTNQLTIKASILEHQNIEEIVARLDREMPQLNIEARMEEITNRASKDLGLIWGFNELSSVTNFKLTSFATIQALEEKNQARLLANPNISVTDSQEGKILIGTKFPVISTNRSDNGIEYSVNYIEVGPKLIVTPRINEDDIITVILKAEVSDITDWRKTGEGDDVPVIRTREASSVIRLREGETFILSGLHQENKTLSESGLPGLSRVPLVGRLFGNKKEGPNEQTEVVIFLTPKIIRFKKEETNDSNVLKIGKQPSSELEIPIAKPNPVSEPSAPIINTPTVQEGTDKQNTPSNNGSLNNAPKNVPTLNENINPKPKSRPLQEEPVDNEIPAEGKNMPDLSNLPKAMDLTRLDTASPVSTSVTVKPVDSTKLRIKSKTGETVTVLAKKYGITKESILAENQLKSETLAGGTELVLPIPKNHFYEIKPKETLWRIAKRYGTTVELLMEINNITDHTKIEKGQAIILPVAVDKIANNKF